MPIQSINPANGTLLRSFDPLTPAVLQQKLALAAETFTTYSAIPVEHRSLWMRRLASLLDSDSEELALLITSEMGKPIVAARQEIAKCAAACRFFADNAAHLLQPESIPTEAAASYIQWDPLGVILAVMPWNFPFWQVFRFLAPALVAGNVGLLKHAPNVPQCALAIEALVRRAGFPRGAFQTLLIEVREVESLLADDRIAAVSLTGGELAGKTVAAHAAWNLKKSVLELGGSDPFLVMPSANLGRAAQLAAKARCQNSGQSCIAAKRFIVHDSVYADFERLFLAAMESMRVGDPLSESTDIGPLATPAHVNNLEGQVHAARHAGARLLTGGERMLGQGNYFEPTILAGLPRTAPVYREEFFGPVALLFRAQNAAEALEIANDTPFGLAASVWTEDPAESQFFTRHLQCGAVFVNAVVASDPRLPFGGIKHSGYGRELSTLGLREFLNAKTIYIAQPETPLLAPAPEQTQEQASFTQNDFTDALEAALATTPARLS